MQNQALQNCCSLFPDSRRRAPLTLDPPNPLLVLPLLPVDDRHGLEAGAVLDLAGDGLRALDAALGHVEGDVDAGGDGARHQADGELPQELQRGVLAREGGRERVSATTMTTTTTQVARAGRRRARGALVHVICQSWHESPPDHFMVAGGGGGSGEWGGLPAWRRGLPIGRARAHAGVESEDL